MFKSLETVLQSLGGIGAVVAAIFFGGRFFQRLIRGDVGDPKLTPMQRLIVDVEKLSETVKREIAELRAQIGVQYTELTQRFNIDHGRLRQLIEANDNEYQRLSEKFYTKEMVDRMFRESEQDRHALREEIAEIDKRCFNTHHRMRGSDT